MASASILSFSGKKIYIFRPCMIHGPGNKGNLNLLFNMVRTGYPWPLGAYENKRSFTSIDNLSYIIRQIIEKEIEPGIYQVADDEALSTNELFRLIAESQNKKPRIWNISGKLISLLARMGDVLQLPLNSERLQKLTESYVVSNQKIKKALEIENMPVSARDGLKKTLESFKG
jgi:nucleoside-diphosphate-sugar epimerase